MEARRAFAPAHCSARAPPRAQGTDNGFAATDRDARSRVSMDGASNQVRVSLQGRAARQRGRENPLCRRRRPLALAPRSPPRNCRTQVQRAGGGASLPLINGPRFGGLRAWRGSMPLAPQPLSRPPLPLVPAGRRQQHAHPRRKRAKKADEGDNTSPAKRQSLPKSPGHSRSAERKPASPSEQYKQSHIISYLRPGTSQPATASAAAPAHVAAVPAVRSPPRAARAGRSSASPAVAAAPPQGEPSPGTKTASAAHVTDVAAVASPARASATPRTAASAPAATVPTSVAPAPAAAQAVPAAPVAASERPASPSATALEQARAAVEKRLAEEKTRREAAERSGSQAQAQLDHLHGRMRTELEDLLRASAVEEARARRLRTAEEEQELGRIIYVRRAPHLPPQEMWEDGIAFHEWRKKRDGVQRERERLEKRKKEVAKAMRLRTRWRRQHEEASGERGTTPSSESSMPPPALPASACDGEDTGDVVGFGPVFQSPAGLRDPSLACAWDDIGEAQEWISVQLANLKRRESELEEERRRLDARKALVIKELRRQADERGACARGAARAVPPPTFFPSPAPVLRGADSRFSTRPLLGERYLLLKLLGRGGFSEVWHAYDVHDLKHVRRRAAAVHGARLAQAAFDAHGRGAGCMQGPPAQPRLVGGA